MITYKNAGFAVMALCLSIIMGLCTGIVSAENIFFPHAKSGLYDASGFIDITLPPYEADKTGKTDVTAVLQKACSDNNKWTTIYLPNGTYLVSNTIRISEICLTTPTQFNCAVWAPIVQGQSRAGTVIRLAPGSFTSATSPKPVLYSGDGVAQIFKRGIHNLTVLIGANNPGANGVRWFSNNFGLMSDVGFLSEDNAANIGVDLAGGEQGPCGMRDIYVKGFSIGCKSDALNSVTILNLTVENARQYGVLNSNNPLYIDNLVCVNASVGVSNAGSLMLINAQLTGGTAAKSAIENTGLLFARDVRAGGYQKALTTTGRAGPSGLAFAEYSSNQISQFPSPARSMGLPCKNMPDIPWEQDTTKWGNVWANIGGLGGNRKSDSASLQSLIDNPNITSICVPFGKLLDINGDILVRGNIQRIVGTGGSFIGKGRLIITSDLAQPVIKLERLDGLEIVNQSNKSVVIESYAGNITSTGAGDLFMCDVGRDFLFDNPNERIWAWQFNAEGSWCTDSQALCPDGSVHTNLQVNNVKTLRIVGWKDEGNAYSMTLVKGVVEILGFMNYPGLQTAGQTEFFVRDGGQFSLACETQISFNGNEYKNLVSETRNGVTKILTSSTSGTGFDLPLYTGYDSTIVAGAVRVLPAAKAAAPAGGRNIRVFAARGALTISWGSGFAPDRLDIVDVMGRIVAFRNAFDGRAGTINGLAAGAYRIVVSGKSPPRAVSAVVVE